MKVILFASADIDEYSFCEQYLKEADCIICCDGGMRHTKKMGILPNYILGDFDSVSPEILEYYCAMNIEIKRFSAQKDETDMELGVDFAIELGADEIIMIGGIGSRIDHTLANVQLLMRLLKKGIKAKLVNEKNEIQLIDREITVYGKKGDLVSTIPLSMEVKGIDLYGFEYPLKNATLSIGGDIIAVSNVMLGEKAEIKIKEGYLLIIKAKD